MKGRIALLSLLATIVFACEKGEGEGGTNTIKGVVIMEEWNGDFTIKRDEYPAQKEDVFIVYGEDDFYGNSVETNYNGVYEFEYLREGTYYIYAYSKDPSNNYNITDKRMVVMDMVKISGKNKTVWADTLYIKR
jgi:hypothetical protein